MTYRRRPLVWRSVESERFRDLERELQEFGQRAVADPKILTDLRSLHWHLSRMLQLSEAESPAVAERRLRSQIARMQGEVSSLEGELSKVRGASS